MAIGQGVLGTSVLDVAAVDRLTARLEARETARSVQHAEQLADVLALSRVWAEAGMSLGTEAHLALALSCSEARAGMMLHSAKALERLGALGPMRDGLLTIEQSHVVEDLLGPVDEALGAQLWERLSDRLRADRAEGIVRPPARLRELLSRWLIAADPDAWAARRKEAALAEADVELWKRKDGQVDLIGRALSPADAIACSDRIDALARPLGPDDDRTTGQRRQGAFVDLLLGRVALPFDETTGETTAQPIGALGGGCCPPGASAPCGAQIFIHVPIDSATGGSTEPAELVGHGPIDPGLLADLLTAAPLLRRVWIDAQSAVPVAVDDRVWTPGCDPDALRQVLAEMRTGPPPDRTDPVHPNDHPPDTAEPIAAEARDAPFPLGSDPPSTDPPSTDSPSTDSPSTAPPWPRVLTRPHLADPGGYVPPRRLKQLARARAPRCEWPGCGRRASRAVAVGCDLDHDLAWPYGPTCACNLGPLCRRHHRVKQLGWIKQRRPDGSVRWIDPTGRTWTSPSQHPQPTQPQPQEQPRRRQVAPGVWALCG